MPFSTRHQTPVQGHIASCRLASHVSTIKVEVVSPLNVSLIHWKSPGLHSYFQQWSGPSRDNVVVPLIGPNLPTTSKTSVCDCITITGSVSHSSTIKMEGLSPCKHFSSSQHYWETWLGPHCQQSYNLPCTGTIRVPLPDNSRKSFMTEKWEDS